MASQLSSIVELLAAELTYVSFVRIIGCLKLNALFHQILAGLNPNNFCLIEDFFANVFAYEIDVVVRNFDLFPNT
jgi:hypothetical protein